MGGKWGRLLDDGASRSRKQDLTRGSGNRHEKWREKGEEESGVKVRGAGSGEEVDVRDKVVGEGVVGEESVGEVKSRITGNRPETGIWPETGSRPEQITGGERDTKLGQHSGHTGNRPETGIRPETGSRPKKRNIPMAATVEKDEIFGKRKGYPTGRRPVDFQREMSQAPVDEIDEWFSQAQIKFGAEVEKNEEQRRAARLLMFTWKDMFITDTAKMTGTDLVTHTIPTWDNAVPVRAKSRLYTPRERQWMETNIPKLLEAKIIDHSFSPRSHRTKFVPKKDGDLRMVHIYCPINDARIPNAYPMR